MTGNLNSKITHQYTSNGLGPLVVNGTTVQIPNFSSFTDDKFVIISLHRYAYCGSIVLPIIAIRRGDAASGSIIYMQNSSKYYVITVNTSGKITLTASTGDGDPYVDIVVA